MLKDFNRMATDFNGVWEKKLETSLVRIGIFKVSINLRLPMADGSPMTSAFSSA